MKFQKFFANNEKRGVEMKKILVCLTVLACCSTPVVFAETFTAVSEVPNENVQITKNVSKDPYFRFYNVDSQNISVSYNNLSRDEEKALLKNLSSYEKDNYKYVKKVQKLISQNRWNEVFYKYPNFYPAYIQYYDYYHSKNDYQKALPILVKISNLNKYNNVLDNSSIDYNLGVLYLYNSQYSQALNYLKKFEYKQDGNIISAIADCYYYTGNYNAAISYLKKLPSMEYHNKETAYGAYYALGNSIEANKYAKSLLSTNYNFDNLLKVAQTCSNNSDKLTYAYKAKGMATSDRELKSVNHIIAGLEQKKLEQRVVGLTQFVKLPKWVDYEKQIPSNVAIAELSAKQDEFFKNANLYLNKYKGQQLTNAFNSLNQDFTNYIQNKQNQYYQQQQLKAQEELVQEQQRNNMLQQQLLYEQRMRNYLERQNFYYMSRPYYYSPIYHGWW